jgi:uncharacterized protein
VTDILASFALSTQDWIFTALCATFVGMVKTGLYGASLLIVPILAGVYGGRASTGILLPLLSVGDVAGVALYRRHAEWLHVLRLLPWAVAGIVVGVVVGDNVSDRAFTFIIGATVLGGLVLMIINERRDQTIVPTGWWFSALLGLLGGFTTMIGNAAGPVLALYLLSMRLPKYAFIGTQAWFFLIVNLVKVPFHVFVWKTITPRTLMLDTAMLPAIAVGAVIGVTVTRLIPERAYRIFVIVSTALAAIKLFL